VIYLTLATKNSGLELAVILLALVLLVMTNVCFLAAGLNISSGVIYIQSFKQ